MDIILLHNRAKLVKKYRESPNLWPDGIDTMDDPWYGEGRDWPAEKVELWSSQLWLEDQLRNVTRVTRDVTQAVTQVTTLDKKRLQAKDRMARMRARKMLAEANPKGGKGE